MTYYLGTSGWSYDDWEGRFYPEDTSRKEWLQYYARHFSSVEINMTFYRFPKPEILKGWVEKTPSNFKFTLKANRQITHRKKIVGVKNDIRYFYILANSLGNKLGCILFQLPPSVTLDLDLLKNFLSVLSQDYKNVIEFRHQSWYTEEVYELLKDHKVTLCTVSSPKLPELIVETSDISYFRFHGKIGWYKYEYSEEELSKWAERIKQTRSKECYIYFNNDYHAHAVHNCITLSRFLGIQ